ncbi:MAG TPA: F0F1 ATP synthase subunit B [Candidatus Paceibacterota bacterium]|nr:F0F1 ATP synthase subunit B [Candidatus Paceibacterota bacterium]
MQQLFAAFGINWSLLIAQAVNFAIVLVALRYFLYKPVMAMLTKRQELVAKSVSDAAKAEELFEGADAEAASRVHAADTEAESIVAQARETAGAEKARLLKEAEERAALIAKDADARAAEAVERARRESERDIARLAVLAAEKVLKEHHD